MKKQVEKREDLEQLLVIFYQKVLKDILIGRFFTEVIKLDLEKHIPVIADFWEGVVFNKLTYNKNVMLIHQQISFLSPIKKEHLDRWLEIFSGTVDEYFIGDKAELMKQRARSVAVLMDIKFNHSKLPK
ncbi:MAG TPA: group III truncated hemoglobin [Flavisolibacter sp.]|nr:group III truncated hemoglobin [Flavisolibacter sp.]